MANWLQSYNAHRHLRVETEIEVVETNVDKKDSTFERNLAESACLHSCNTSQPS